MLGDLCNTKDIKNRTETRHNVAEIIENTTDPRPHTQSPYRCLETYNRKVP